MVSIMASSRDNADKENVYKSRIPLPKNPLPALPKHLLVNKKMARKPEVPHRNPLKIINAQSTSIPKAGPSKVAPHTSKHPLSIPEKHITMRQRSEDLDWHHNVFKDKDDEDSNASIVSSSDDEHKVSQQHLVEKKKKNAVGALLSAVTTSVKDNLEPNRMRNIKRSLKRLQGLSPIVETEEDESDDKVERPLNFNVGIQDVLRTPDFCEQSQCVQSYCLYMQRYNQDYGADLFEYLLANEMKPLNIPNTTSISRACVINWLMKVNGADGNPAVLQAACWYFDSVLGKRLVRLDKLQLVAAACFWIAQKLNGRYKTARKLVDNSDSAFTTDELRAAEKAVLIKLKFPKQPIVAQEYITYLCWWCDCHNAGDIEEAATFLAMCGLLVNRVLCDEYPSVVAAAAVRNALFLLRKYEMLPRLQMCYVFMAAEKKATNLLKTCSILSRAVRTVAATAYEYKTPLLLYGTPPRYIAQIIIHAANEVSVTTATNTEGC